MKVLSILWDKYQVASNQYSSEDLLAINWDTNISPIIHAMHINGRKIFVNKGVEAHLLLLNLAKISPGIFLKIAVLYELVSIFLEYRYLDAATFVIEKLKNEIEVLIEIEDITSDPINLDLQFEFFIGHERAHWQYENNLLLREDARNKLKEIINIYSLPQNLIQRIFFPKIKKMFKSESFIEEMCCDRNSIIYFLHEIPNSKMLDTVRQLSQLLYMLQLHNDLEELIGFSLRKGLSKHLSRFYFDVIRGANIAWAIIEKCEDNLENSQMDGNVIKNLIIENSQFYNHIHNALLDLWKSNTDIFISIKGNHPDMRNQNKFDSLVHELNAISEEIISRKYN